MDEMGDGFVTEEEFRRNYRVVFQREEFDIGGRVHVESARKRSASLAIIPSQQSKAYEFPDPSFSSFEVDNSFRLSAPEADDTVLTPVCKARTGGAVAGALAVLPDLVSSRARKSFTNRITSSQKLVEQRSSRNRDDSSALSRGKIQTSSLFRAHLDRNSLFSRSLPMDSLLGSNSPHSGRAKKEPQTPLEAYISALPSPVFDEGSSRSNGKFSEYKDCHVDNCSLFFPSLFFSFNSPMFISVCGTPSSVHGKQDR